MNSYTSRDSAATRASLLFAIRQNPADNGLWDQFVQRYAGLIEKWCRSWGLQHSDRHDVTQEVLLSLSRAMQSFEYDSTRSFRAWLKTVTRNAWTAMARKNERPGRGRGDTAMQERLDCVEAREDLARRLEEQYDSELQELAILRVRMRVRPRTWQAFELTALQDEPAAQVAEQLQMKVAHVYVARSEVLKALRQEIQRLEPQED